MYDQKIEEDIAARSPEGAEELAGDPRLTIRPYTEIRQARVGAATGALSLSLYNPITHESREAEYDVVVCGTGYNRQAWRSILFPETVSGPTERSESEHFMPLEEAFAARQTQPAPPDLSLPDSAFAETARPIARRSPSSDGSSSSDSTAASRIDSPARWDSPSRNSSVSGESTSTAATSPPSPRSLADSKTADSGRISQVPDFSVKENYRLDLPAKTTSGAQFRPTVWLQGSCEKTHGISDSLLR